MPKNIVICSDGTGNTAIKGRGTNVFKLYEAVDTEGHKTDPSAVPQIAFYDDGVGTERLKPLALLGGAFGAGLSRNVKQLYANLARVYEPNDRIFLFGFSRGAFTVRTLAGLVAACGIVNRHPPVCRSDDELWEHVEAAYAAYRDRYRTQAMTRMRGRAPDAPASALDVRQRLAVRHDPLLAPAVEAWQVPIEFIGVWDTVDAVGFPDPHIADAWNALVYPFKFPDHRLGPMVKRARHALAIDDERHTFHPLLWDEQGDTTGRIVQVWFSGAHSNVGGGYPKQGMSLVPLTWMMDEAAAAGLRFTDLDRALYRERQNVDDKLYDSRAGLAFYYRYRPRDIDTMCRENGITPTVHASVLERIVDGPDGYAPGNIPRGAGMAGRGNPALPLRVTLQQMQAALHSNSSLLDRVRGLVRTRELSQYVVLALTLIMVVLAAWSGLTGATGGGSLDWLSLQGLATLVGGFLLAAVRGARWSILLLVVAAVLAYLLNWLVGKRIHRVFSEFWYAVRVIRAAGAPESPGVRAGAHAASPPRA